MPSIVLGGMIVARVGGVLGDGGTIVFLSLWALLGLPVLILALMAEGVRPASGARDWTYEQGYRLVPAWLDVAEAAGVVEPDYVLVMDESTVVHGYARGRWVVQVSSEAVRQLREPQLQGLLAHELGHLLSSRRAGSWAVAGWYALPLYVVPRLAFGIARTPAEFARQGGLLRLLLLWAATVVYFGTAAWVLVLLLGPFHAFVAAVLLFMQLLATLAAFRWDERMADRVAVDLGFGDGLAELLREHGRDACFGVAVRAGRHPISALLSAPLSTHPLTRKRIRAIESRMSAHTRAAR
ncbi:M48 family metalloprotease [Nocardia sp. NPDC055321]